MGPEGTFITGSDFLMDGGVTAQYWYGAAGARIRAPAVLFYPCRLREPLTSRIGARKRGSLKLR